LATVSSSRQSVSVGNAYSAALAPDRVGDLHRTVAPDRADDFRCPVASDRVNDFQRTVTPDYPGSQWCVLRVRYSRGRSAVPFCGCEPCPGTMPFCGLPTMPCCGCEPCPGTVPFCGLPTMPFCGCEPCPGAVPFCGCQPDLSAGCRHSTLRKCAARRRPQAARPPRPCPRVGSDGAGFPQNIWRIHSSRAEPGSDCVGLSRGMWRIHSRR
jgi:hypothetical protein